MCIYYYYSNFFNHWFVVFFPHRNRRGAINSKQLTYLEKYRSKQRLRFKDPHNHKSKCCLMWSGLTSLPLKEPVTHGLNRTKITNLVHLNFCYNSGGEFNPLLVYMSDPCTQGLHQLRAVKDEPLEFCLYTQTSPILTVFTNLLWTQIYARCTHSCYQPSHFTSSTQSKDDHRTQEQELNHCCYAHAFVWNCLTTLFLHVTVLFWRCVWVV